jgi:hypothetical protein
MSNTQTIAEELSQKWIARERDQRMTSPMSAQVGEPISGTTESEATKLCRLELQRAFGLVTQIASTPPSTPTREQIAGMSATEIIVAAYDGISGYLIVERSVTTWEEADRYVREMACMGNPQAYPTVTVTRDGEAVPWRQVNMRYVVGEERIIAALDAFAALMEAPSDYPMAESAVEYRSKLAIMLRSILASGEPLNLSLQSEMYR